MDKKASLDQKPHVTIDVKEGTGLLQAHAVESCQWDESQTRNNEHDHDYPPPAFAPYEAKYFEKSNGDIISHDPHLNEDGEALYRFLLSQSLTPPTYKVTITGTHREIHTTSSGRVSEDDERIITDFSFSILLTPYIATGPEEYTYPDNVPTYRGLVVKQIMAGRPGSGRGEMVKRKATKQERKTERGEKERRWEKGLPSWLDLEGKPSWKKQASSWTLREWADDYAASKKILKEFVYTKKVYGWSTKDLTSALLACIRTTGYTGTIDVQFTLSSNRIIIRPTNRLSRTLSRTLYKVLLILFLVYPFIWVFKRFSRFGGGRWKVGGAMYCLKVCEDLGAKDSEGGAETRMRIVKGGHDGYSDSIGKVDERAKPKLKPRIVQGEDGAMRKITGYREGEWFQEWEEVIKNAVLNRVEKEEPYVNVEEGPKNPIVALDGFQQRQNES